MSEQEDPKVPKKPEVEQLVPGVVAPRPLAAKIRICVQAAWEAARAVALAYGDKVRPWPNAPQKERDEATRDFLRYMAGQSPESDHDAFIARLKADGWTLGEKHSEVLRTHPAMVPYWDLPEHVRMPGLAFWQVALRMAGIFGLAMKPPTAPAPPPANEAAAAPPESTEPRMGETGTRG